MCSVVVFAARCRSVGVVRRVGGVAQLGERVNGIHEVRGSIPLASTPCFWDAVPVVHDERLGCCKSHA